jgi:aryl-alcohol dehydrogenase-like predicted oxidoreductase
MTSAADLPSDGWRARTFLDGTAYPIALGGAGLSFNQSVDDERAVETIHAALDAGVTVIDTARAYTRHPEAGHNERLVARAVRELGARLRRLSVVTKGGEYWRDPEHWALDGSPEALRRDCEASLVALDVPRIDLYLLHWPDPKVPIEISAGALAGLVGEGMVARVGLSNVSVEQLERARRVTTISAVENHFSPFDQRDRAMVDTCARLGIAYLSYAPFGGPHRPTDLAQRYPRSVEAAASLGVTVHRLWLAWLLRASPAVIPIVGATRPTTIRDAAAATRLDASTLDWRAVDTELQRYQPAAPGT